jgi:hypothetical protein
LKNDLNFASKSDKAAKIVLKNLSFVGILKVSDENSRIRIEDPDPYPKPDTLIRGMDPRIRIHPKRSSIRNTGSEIDNCHIRGGGGFGEVSTSVVNPRCFPGSRFLFPIPDLGSKISDPRATKKRRKNSFQFAYFFCHHTKLSEHMGWIRDPRPEVRDPEKNLSRIQNQRSTKHRIRICNTVLIVFFLHMVRYAG